MKVANFKRFSLKMLRCEARAFPVGTAYMISRPFFTLWKTRMCMNLDHVASGHFVLTWERRSLRVPLLAIGMPPTKVCPHCKPAVPVRRKTCERCNLREKAMKRMRAVESDSVKLARKAKDKLHKACERASETRERTLHRQEQNNAHGKHERVCTVLILGPSA